MKIKFLIPIIAIALIAMACDPIEDTGARDEFAKKGTPISVEQLNAALSVTQPIPNADDKIEGDQYVVLKNARTDIPGTWFIETPIGTLRHTTDIDTVIYGANNTYEIYFVGLSEGQSVRSKTFTVTITNCFDDYDRILSGAKDKADKTAKKTWKFLDKSGALYNGMYGNWKYLPWKDENTGAINPIPGQNSWGTVSTATVEEKTMTFVFDGHTMTTNFADNSVSQTGAWSYTHEQPEDVIGELYTTAPVLGTSKSWNVWKGASTPYWIMKITENELVLCFPSVYNKPSTVEDWDIDAMYFFFVPKE